MDSTARLPVPMSNSVPAMIRTIWCRNAVPWISRVMRSPLRRTSHFRILRTGVLAVQPDALKLLKSCSPSSTLAAAPMALSSSACLAHQL